MSGVFVNRPGFYSILYLALQNHDSYVRWYFDLQYQSAEIKKNISTTDSQNYE